MTFTLRPYQQEVVDRVERSFSDSNGGVPGVPCVVSPTGSGKALMAMEVARRRLEAGQKVAICCHRREILAALLRTAEKHLPASASLSVVKAGVPSDQIDWEADVLIFMVATLSRRLRNLPAGAKGRVLLIDECHHVGATSWERTIKALEWVHLAGFTATPIDPRGWGLGHPFTELIQAPNTRQLIEMGFLSPYSYWLAKPAESIKTDGCPVRGGDYQLGEQLQQAAKKVIGHAADAYRQYNPQRLPTLVMTVSLNHARQVVEHFNDAGITATSVDGGMPDKERDRIIRDFESGKLDCLVVVGIGDEGWDCENISCCMWLRPTMSRRLYFQYIGRVLRTKEGKEAIIIDMAENAIRLGLPCDPIDWKLHAHQESKPVPQEGELVRDESGRAVRRVVEVREAEFVKLQPGDLETVNPYQVLLDLQDLSWAHRVRRQSWGRRKQVLDDLDRLRHEAPLWALQVAAEVAGFNHPHGWADHKRLEAALAYLATDVYSDPPEWLAAQQPLKAMFTHLCIPQTPRKGLPGKAKFIGVVPTWRLRHRPHPEGQVEPVVLVRMVIDPSTRPSLQADLALAAKEAWERVLRDECAPMEVEIVGLRRRKPWLRPAKAGPESGAGRQPPDPPRRVIEVSGHRQAAEQPHRPNPLRPTRRRHAHLIRR